MIIRFALSKDKEEVLELLNELGEAENKLRGFSPERTKAHIFGKKMFDEIIESKNSRIFLAEENGKILGVATFFLVPYVRFGKMRGYVIDFVVRESHRGKGVGSKIILAVKEFCKKNNIQRVKVDTGFHQAKKFYINNGGEITTETFTFIVDK